MLILGTIIVLVLTSLGSLFLLEASVFPPIFNNASLAHLTFLKKKLGGESAEVVFRWFGICLIITGTALNYFVKSEGWLVFVFSIGFVLAIGNIKVVFTKQGLEWMYFNGNWQTKWPYDEKSRRNIDRMYAFRGVLVGMTMLALSVLGLFFPPQ
jgi:hypothetical protein